MQEEIRVAAEVLLYSGKPVLLAGAPGTGKTSLGFELSRSFTGMDPIEVVGRGDIVSRELLYSYEPYGEGFRVIIGRLALSIMASWARLMLGLSPRWALFDELNRMNAEITLGNLFTALDLIHRNRVTIVPYWLVERTLKEEELLSDIALAANLDVSDTKNAIAKALEKSRKRILDGLPLPYSWRAVATINLVDRSHLFRLGFALLRRFSLVLFPGIGAELRPYIDNEELTKLTKQYKEDNVYKYVLNLFKGNLCREALRELNASSSLTIYDVPLYAFNLNEETVINALNNYEHTLQIVALTVSWMSDVGVEIGPAILADVCRLLITAILYNRINENLLVDVVVASLLLPQLGTVAPLVKAELLLGGNINRAIRVQKLLERVKNLLGDKSMSAMYAEALKLEIPLQSM